MFDRLAVAAAVAVLAIGTLTVGATLILRHNDSAAGPCPRPFSEADAVDTFAAGLTQSQRAWGIAGGAPGRVRPGVIAGFDGASGSDLAVVTIDPATGDRCVLVTLRDEIIREHLNQLDWSPSGDALAIGLENPEPADGDPAGQTGQVLIWTANRLVRVWVGEGQQPGVEWAPDGGSIAIWMAAGNQTPSGVQRIFADGSATQAFTFQPFYREGLKWSPDGSHWAVAETSGPPASTLARTLLSVVDIADGRVTPIDLGIQNVRLWGWIGNDHLLLQKQEAGDAAYINVPLAAPASYSVVSLPSEAFEQDVWAGFSPDRHHAAWVTAAGDLEIADITAGPGANPVRVPYHFDAGGGFSPGLAWAPDGSQVVFTQVAGPFGANGASTYATQIVNADGTGLQQIGGPDLSVMDDPWQPVPVQ